MVWLSFRFLLTIFFKDLQTGFISFSIDEEWLKKMKS